MPDTRKLRLAVLPALLAAAILSGTPARPKKTPTPAAKPRDAGPRNSCTTCLERRPILDPALFATGFGPEVQAAYRVARKYPDTLDRIHCFCECKESPVERHKTLLTCYTNQHAAGCGICQREALLAGRLKDQGMSDEEVELTVESVSKTDGHPPTFGRGL
jgi:hypothetical protein